MPVTFNLPLLPMWWPWVALMAASLLFILWVLRSAPARQLSVLWVKSFLENERFSPRLLTIFFFVSVTVFLEIWLFRMNKPEALMLVYVQVIAFNLTLITSLLGLGKWTDAYQKIKLGKATPDTVVNSTSTQVSGENVSVAEASGGDNQTGRAG